MARSLAMQERLAWCDSLIDAQTAEALACRSALTFRTKEAESLREALLAMDAAVDAAVDTERSRCDLLERQVRRSRVWKWVAIVSTGLAVGLAMP